MRKLWLCLRSMSVIQKPMLGKVHWRYDTLRSIFYWECVSTKWPVFWRLITNILFLVFVDCHESAEAWGDLMQCRESEYSFRSLQGSCCVSEEESHAVPNGSPRCECLFLSLHMSLEFSSLLIKRFRLLIFPSLLWLVGWFSCTYRTYKPLIIAHVNTRITVVENNL